MTITRTQRRILVSGVLVFAAVWWAPGEHAAASDEVAVGESTFEFSPDVRRPCHKLKVWTYRPEGFGPNGPVVFVMHGVKRNGKTYRDTWAPHSRKDGFLLLVPEFPEDEYPGEAYQQGNIRDRKGQSVPPEGWTFAVIERLFDHVKSLTGSRAEKYYLYGHSAGAQFVQRFVLFMPEARYARAVAANPGYYTFPTQEAEFPYGLKGTPIAGPIKPALFGRDFVLMLGAEDTDRDDPNLRKAPEADAQGLTRLERGMNYFRTATRLAEKADAKFTWRLVTVPGVGHSDQKMSASAARELFAKPR
jgi:pimeloyl-ACP methyl ester carboxylesterase